jgi:hypothetical protein
MTAPEGTTGYKVCPRCGKRRRRATDYSWRANGTMFTWCKACNREYARDRAAKKRAERGVL